MFKRIKEEESKPYDPYDPANDWHSDSEKEEEIDERSTFELWVQAGLETGRPVMFSENLKLTDRDLNVLHKLCRKLKYYLTYNSSNFKIVAAYPKDWEFDNEK